MSADALFVRRKCAGAALALALLATFAPAARAQYGQYGLNLSWDHCFADGGVARTLFDCSTNGGQGVLIASVVIPTDLPQFAAASPAFDFFIDDGAIPPWWQVASGQCRPNGIRASFDPNTFPASETCPAIWDGQVPLFVQVIQVGLKGTNTFRLTGAAAVPAGSEIFLSADGTDRVVCRVTVNHAKTVGTGACDGCRIGACILFTQMKLEQAAGVGDYYLGSPYWNTLVGHNADALYGAPTPWCTTPALDRTWGAIKALYR